MSFYDTYCSRCVKSWFPHEGKWPSEKTLLEYVRIGKYCKLQHAIDLAVLIDGIPKDVGEEFGFFENDVYKKCCKFSGKEEDRFKYPSVDNPIHINPDQIKLNI